ncbi:MAG TPA: AMP-binding protein, partial [Rubrobacter sp.]|nr:AMP-binding protein [Rubrobacter sp.]
MNEDNSSVPCPLRAAALASPEAAAVAGVRGTITFEELDRFVSAAALRLGEFEPGSRMALYLPKDERYVVLLLALIRAGHVVCPISDRLPPHGVAQLLKRAACSALISGDEKLLQTVGADLYRLRPGTLLEAGSSSDRAEPIVIPLNRPATIIFTSGSTGVPKAAL